MMSYRPCWRFEVQTAIIMGNVEHNGVFSIGVLLQKCLKACWEKKKHK